MTTDGRNLTDWLRDSRWTQNLDHELRARLTALLLAAAKTAGAYPDPARVTHRTGALFEGLAQRRELLAWIIDRPTVLQRAVHIIGASPPFGDFLIGRPEMLRGLESCHPPRLESALDGARDEEATLVALRAFKWTRVLQILASDLEGRITLDQVSHALSDLADLLLSTVLARASVAMGLGAESPMGLICYGKLGSREMSYASDTDIVFIYDDRLGFASEQLTGLAATVNRWLTAHTEMGPLYATDFRLRPHGESGLLVSSLAAFRHYQMSSAWTWEHQALTRARWLACHPDLGRALRDVRSEVLRRPRDGQRLRDDVLSMRNRMWRQAPPVGRDAFDVKHSRGGIIDVEFIAQHLILRHAAANAELCDVTGVAGVLARGAELSLLPGHGARAAVAAYQQYRAWIHRERLRGNETIRVTVAEAAPHQRAVVDLWRQVFDA